MSYFFLYLALVLVDSVVVGDKTKYSPPVWAVRLNHDDHLSVAENVGLTSLGRVFSDVHEFRLTKTNHDTLRRQLGHDDDTILKHVHSSVVSHPSVVWAELQKPLKRERRSSDSIHDFDFNDPSYTQQWHLVSDSEYC